MSKNAQDKGYCWCETVQKIPRVLSQPGRLHIYAPERGCPAELPYRGIFETVKVGVF